jgi:hypothetical protein
MPAAAAAGLGIYAQVLSVSTLGYYYDLVVPQHDGAGA